VISALEGVGGSYVFKNVFSFETPLEFYVSFHFHRPQKPIGRIKLYLNYIFDLGTRRGWGASVTPWPQLTPGKNPVPPVLEAVWSSRPVWSGAKNLAPQEFHPRLSSSYAVAILTPLLVPQFEILNNKILKK